MLGHPASPLLWSANGDNLDRRALSAWCAYTGQNEGATQDWRWLAALHPDDRKEVRDAWGEAIRLQHSITLVYRIYHIHEGYRLFKVLHVPLFTDEHQLQAWFLFFSEELANPPEINGALARTFQLETVFEAITDGIIVCNRDGKVIQSNTAMHRLLHLDACPSYLNLPFQQRLQLITLIDEHGQTIPQEQWPISRLLRGEYLHEGRTGDLRIHLLDGEESYVNISGAPMLDQDNQIVGAVMVIHDVKERHLLESRIRKSFRILLALAEVLVDIPERHREIALAQVKSNGQVPSGPPFRPAGEYIATLTCQMMEYRGVSISQIDADTVLHMVAIAGSTGESRDDYYQKYANVPLAAILAEDDIILLRDNEVVIRELVLHVKDSQVSNYLLAPMITDGHLVGILSVEKKEDHASYTHEEISLTKAIAKFILLVIERERIQHDWVAAHSSELALREANQRFDEFLIIASHELRTPLAGIKGNLQLALRRLKALQSNKLPEMDVLLEKLEKTREFLREAEDRVNVQNRMISDLLDVSRIHANKLELVIGSCDLNKVACGAVKDQQHTTPERVITLEPPCGDRELTVLGDADRLGQVVHNYLSNALKYSPPDAPVSVQVAKLADEVRVSVHDQGPGLTPEEQKHVWERFYRVKGVVAQGASTPSMGLGLHICRTIIEAHHGQIGLESSPGEGSTFWFSLPLVQPDVLESEQPSKALPQRASGT
jgi:signal transduction histidine kinase/PAS domain-containing protein